MTVTVVGSRQQQVQAVIRCEKSADPSNISTDGILHIQRDESSDRRFDQNVVAQTEGDTRVCICRQTEKLNHIVQMGQMSLLAVQHTDNSIRTHCHGIYYGLKLKYLPFKSVSLLLLFATSYIFSSRIIAAMALMLLAWQSMTVLFLSHLWKVNFAAQSMRAHNRLGNGMRYTANAGQSVSIAWRFWLDARDCKTSANASA